MVFDDDYGWVHRDTQSAIQKLESNIEMLEIRHASVMLHTQAIVNENIKMREWIDKLELLAENKGEQRSWHGDIGWLYTGQSAYVGDSREGILSNDQEHLQREEKA